MHRIAAIIDVRSGAQAWVEEGVAWLIGFGFTCVLFLGMAHFENVGTAEPADDIQEARMVTLPYEPPPPPPTVVETTAVPQAVAPFAGFDVGASESPVHIAVIPPDLETLIPTTNTPPKAMVQFGQLITDFKPRIEIEAEFRHVYQESDVDQVPRAIVRVAPPVTRDIRGNAATLRTVLLLVIDIKGRASSTRVVQSSGNEEFDAIIARTVKEEWVFSPAIRRGKKVKCMAQQAFRVNFSSASIFEVH